MGMVPASVQIAAATWFIQLWLKIFRRTTLEPAPRCVSISPATPSGPETFYVLTFFRGSLRSFMLQNRLTLHKTPTQRFSASPLTCLMCSLVLWVVPCSWHHTSTHQQLFSTYRFSVSCLSQAWELRMEKSAEKWGSGGRRRLLVRGRSWSFLTKIRRKNCIKQPCIFQFCQFSTWCKTITFWFERTVLCFGADIFLFQRKSADPQPIPMPVKSLAFISTWCKQSMALNGPIVYSRTFTSSSVVTFHHCLQPHLYLQFCHHIPPLSTAAPLPPVLSSHSTIVYSRTFTSSFVVTFHHCLQPHLYLQFCRHIPPLSTAAPLPPVLSSHSTFSSVLATHSWSDRVSVISLSFDLAMWNTLITSWSL